MTIYFNTIGPNLETRLDGASVRRRITSALQRTEKISLDFSGVEAVYPSFADECFGKLLFTFENPDFRNQITFVNVSPLIKAVFDNALNKRLFEVA